MFRGIDIRGRFDKYLQRRAKRLLTTIVFVAGLFLILLSIFTMSGLSLAIGLSIGAILIVASWAKMFFVSFVNKELELKDTKSLRQENDSLKETLSQLKTQLQDTRHQKTNMIDIRPIMELGVLEVDCEIEQCFDKFFDNEDKPIIHTANLCWSQIDKSNLQTDSRSKKRFMGLICTKFTARYGIDMKNLRLKVCLEDRMVYVEGSAPSYLGTKGHPVTTWKTCICLRKNWVDTWISDPESQIIESKCKDEYRTRFEETLKAGPSQLDWVKKPLENTVRHLLQMLIVPDGYSLNFVEKIEGESVTFLEHIASVEMNKPGLDRVSVKPSLIGKKEVMSDENDSVDN